MYRADKLRRYKMALTTDLKSDLGVLKTQQNSVDICGSFLVSIITMQSLNNNSDTNFPNRALQGIIQHRQSLNERNKCDVIKQLQIFVEKLQTIEQAIIERAKHECSTYKTTINSRKSTTQDQLIDTVHNPADIRNELQPVNFHQELESIKETCIQICNDIGIGISFDLKN